MAKIIISIFQQNIFFRERKFFRFFFCFEKSRKIFSFEIFDLSRPFRKFSQKIDFFLNESVLG